MKIRTAQTTYKDQPAYSLETDQLQALILPQCGSNLASLRYTPTGKQILFQRPGPTFKRQPYDGVYVDAENAGMDDMFPTIDACACLQKPWQGVLLPDHGEVWSLPWQVSQDEGGLTLTVNGVRLPYTLEKRISFPAANILRMDYRLTNRSPFPFDYLWAAHTMLASEEGAEILLPAGPKKAGVTFSTTGSLGKYGDQLDWPLAALPDGSQRDLRRMRSPAAGDVGKYYLLGALPAGWCAARFHTSGYAVGLSWPAEQVPYLAILPNEGGWDNTSSLYFEPSTCSFDRPDIGRYRGEVSTIGGDCTHTWHLSLSVTTDLNFTHMTPQGAFA